MKSLFLSLSFLTLWVVGFPLKVQATTSVDPLPESLQTLSSPSYLNQWVLSAQEGLLHEEEKLYLIVDSSQPLMASTRPVKMVKPRVFIPAPLSSYEEYFDSFARQFSVNPTTLKKIAYCESKYNPDARSKNATYGGLYQFSASTWVSTRQSMGADPDPDLRFNAREAILTAAFKIAAGGIQAWPVCSRI